NNPIIKLVQVPGKQRKCCERNTGRKKHGENIYRKGLKNFQIDRIDIMKNGTVRPNGEPGEHQTGWSRYKNRFCSFPFHPAKPYSRILPVDPIFLLMNHRDFEWVRDVWKAR